MCQRLCALVVLCCFSLSSLPAEPLPDISTGVEKQSENDGALKNILDNSTALEQDLNLLYEVWKVLKTKHGNLGPLMDAFDQRLTALENRLKESENLLKERVDEVTQLRKDFEDYRAEVNRNKLRDGIIIGVSALAVGVLAGLAIGIGLSR